MSGKRMSQQVFTQKWSKKGLWIVLGNEEDVGQMEWGTEELPLERLQKS